VYMAEMLLRWGADDRSRNLHNLLPGEMMIPGDVFGRLDALALCLRQWNDRDMTERRELISRTCKAHTLLEQYVVPLEWRLQRLLWIAATKESPKRCPLASLPPELVVAVARAASERAVRRRACYLLHALSVPAADTPPYNPPTPLPPHLAS